MPRKTKTSASARELAHEALYRVLRKGAYSNVLLANLPEREGVSPEAARGAVAITLGVLRNYALIESVLQSTAEKKWKTGHAATIAALIGAFEILMSDTPAYAAVNECVKLVSSRGSRAEASFVNACLRRMSDVNVDEFLARVSDPVERLALETSHPAWFVREIFTAYGETESAAILRAARAPLPFYLRANRLRTSVAGLVEKLRAEGFDAVDCAPPAGCVAIPPGGGFPAAAISSGFATPQDRSTQFVAGFPALESGTDVLDLCCGSGVKTTHIAEILGGTGKITALDRSEAKIRGLERMAARLGVGGIDARAVDLLKERAAGEFSRVLLDAPCSGSGVFRRRPEMKLRITEEGPSMISDLQASLLETAAANVRRGGTLVYSTCSILPRENEEVAGAFLRGNPNFVEIESDAGEIGLRRKPGMVISPSRINACGVYMCAMKRVS